MIAHLKGKLILREKGFLVIEVNNLGYQVYTTKFNTFNLGDDLSLWTFYYVGSDNQPALYGFETREAYLLFREFLKVQGVGPKIALKIVESAPSELIQKAILEKDVTFFTQVKGLGKKGAQKIILELQNVLIETNQISSPKQTTVHEALLSLGFSQVEINRALKQVSIDNLSESAAIEKLLQFLGH